MTQSSARRPSSLDDELRAMYRPADPPAHLAELIDARVATARERHRSRQGRAPRQAIVIAASVAVIAVLGVAGGVVAQRLAAGCGMTIEDGLWFSDCVVARPGLTNARQPFAGTDILERTPVEAAAMAAEKGYTIRWQIEERRGTETLDDDQLTFSDEPPSCGRIAAGSVIEDGRIQMVVTINDPLMPVSQC
jgi:hypothetical protein